MAHVLVPQMPATLAPAAGHASEFDQFSEPQPVHQYQMLSDLGKGATAVVKLCKRIDDPDSDRRYAVKIFQKSMLKKQREIGGERGNLVKDDGLSKVKREIAIMKKLLHPNVVQLIEAIDDPTAEVAYLVLEYVSGGAIMTWDQPRRSYVYRPSGGAIPFHQAASFFADVLSGLLFLHANNIIHRDLKPDNILVDARTGAAKIGDFGVAHYFENERQPDSFVARSGSRGLVLDVQGTWAFWPPEACQGGVYNGFGADAWAAGVCLWVFCFGTLPFDHDDDYELFDVIETAPLVFPPECTDAALIDLLTGLLQKDPQQRSMLKHVQAHSWLHQQLTEAELLRESSYKVSVNEADIKNAITFGRGFKIMLPTEILNNLTTSIRKRVQRFSSSFAEPDLDRSSSAAAAGHASSNGTSTSNSSSSHNRNSSSSSSHSNGRSRADSSGSAHAAAATPALAATAASNGDCDLPPPPPPALPGSSGSGSNGFASKLKRFSRSSTISEAESTATVELTPAFSKPARPTVRSTSAGSPSTHATNSTASAAHTAYTAATATRTAPVAQEAPRCSYQAPVASLYPRALALAGPPSPHAHTEPMGRGSSAGSLDGSTCGGSYRTRGSGDGAGRVRHAPPLSSKGSDAGGCGCCIM